MQEPITYGVAQGSGLAGVQPVTMGSPLPAQMVPTPQGFFRSTAINNVQSAVASGAAGLRNVMVALSIYNADTVSHVYDLRDGGGFVVGTFEVDAGKSFFGNVPYACAGFNTSLGLASREAVTTNNSEATIWGFRINQ